MNLQVGFRGIGVQRHVVFTSDLQGLLHRYCKAQVCRPVIEKTYLLQASLLWLLRRVSEKKLGLFGYRYIHTC